MHTEVFVAGGGVGGLALAVKLASRGVHVTVAEQLDKTSPLYKGELLQPKTINILDSLGVLSDVHEYGNKIEDLEFQEVIRHSSGWLEEISNTKLTYNRLAGDFDYALMIPHDRIKAILKEKGEQFPEYFHYLAGARFLGFENGKAAIKWNKDKKFVEADVYVGAEGRSSPTREAMGVSVNRTDYNHHFLTVTIPRPDDFIEGKIVTTNRCLLGMFPLPDNEVRTVYLIKAGEYKQIKEKGLEYVYRAYGSLEPRLKEHVKAIKEWKKIQLMIPYTYHVDKYVTGNIALIGDAAHTVHPMAGEGMNLAIQDADVLGELVAWCKETGRHYHEYLADYEQVRRPHVEFLLKLSHLSAIVYSYPYEWWRRLRMKAVERMCEDDKLHEKQMLNISGLGKWDFSIVDRAIQAGAFPARKQTITDTQQLNHHFQDYPWKK
ncbi:FAD-dependent oxidoreductase [Thalassobacillus pellis]|uniref:FAD-dependent oxidoreductase n=1 Tax=Thalassobacillus pellis TaxID=748008 RepID=UPI001961E1CF|nr:NAD(P)/FAD-dependent oxidoreductase [Thalassobacillus pellis]MBM7551735.1 2-polyprenyl-6-methoxyphenol hydroxylase-like FAD-dependent oxidoreductase [Thalassobacillus pellis]